MSTKKTQEKKKMGRPVGSTSENPADKKLPNVRVTEDKLNAYRQAADKAGLSFSAWVRKWLDRGMDSKE